MKNFSARLVSPMAMRVTFTWNVPTSNIVFRKIVTTHITFKPTRQVCKITP